MTIKTQRFRISELETINVHTLCKVDAGRDTKKNMINLIESNATGLLCKMKLLTPYANTIISQSQNTTALQNGVSQLERELVKKIAQWKSMKSVMQLQFKTLVNDAAAILEAYTPTTHLLSVGSRAKLHYVLDGKLGHLGSA